jgi:predicted N-acetyltransferase YhbS
VAAQHLLGGAARLAATTAVLQRARRADPLLGMWEAADVQWWWRRPRATDAVELPVWFDDDGPCAAAGLTAFDGTWQVDALVVPSAVDVAEVWGVAVAAAERLHGGELRVLVGARDDVVAGLAAADGFVRSGDASGTSWMEAEERPPVGEVDGFAVVDRAGRGAGPHWMVGRNGDAVEERLRACSLYDPVLDLAVEAADGTVAGYALFWSDPTTGVGLLEPMRVEEAFQRRGLGRLLISHGLDRLARCGARRLKVGFESDGARALYLGAGFVQTSADQLLVRPGAGG